MRRDPTEFRQRFQRWKNGEQVYDKGQAIKHAVNGIDSTYDVGSHPVFDSLVVTPHRVAFPSIQNAVKTKLEYDMVKNPGLFDDDDNRQDYMWYSMLNNNTNPFFANLIPHYEDGKDARKLEYHPEEDYYYGGNLFGKGNELVVTGQNRKQKPYWVSARTPQAGFDDLENMALIAGGGIVPVISDIGDVAAIANDVQNKNYLQAVIGAGMFAIPNIIKKPFKAAGKPIYRLARNLGISRQLAHDIISNPKRVIKDKLSGEYAFTEKGRQQLLKRDNVQLNNTAQQIKQNVIDDELIQRRKRIKFAQSKGIQQDILSDAPKDKDIRYEYDPKMYGRNNVGVSTNPIKVLYYNNPNNSFFKYKYKPKELEQILGHEFVHRLESDYHFSPHLITSTAIDGKTGYKVPMIDKKDFIQLPNIVMPSAKPLIQFKDVQMGFSPTLTRYNINTNRIAEADKLNTPNLDLRYHPWWNSPAEVVADMKGAIAAGFDEMELYKFMQDKHGYDMYKILDLRDIGY